ncbi:hypothetical protein [Streptomyces sp. NPDC005805]|uniref:hypothetical protein n=1 Tax=Streptomyces sp. NPDC005805 TaxID=3157068 RepID=UPI0033F34B2C
MRPIRSTSRLTVGALAVALSAVLLPAAGATASEPGTAGAQSPATDSTAVTAETKGDFAALAEAVITKRTAALVEGTQSLARASTPPVGDVRLAGTVARAEDRAVTGLVKRKKLLAELDEAYTAADTDVTID